ncbi:TetR family transcriptional regulator [Brevundimonas sp. DS20]|uniref:TetR family transcriptional regulator n=1 Tax=Brevundimonas sp. DS20 TaxID=1532555 RepID=UPI0018D03197|nr:TetR family transcriptional regulator [Brevundimonas sp. DS20]
MQEKVFPGEQGLRARKRLETHARIQAEGLRLFIEKGFDGATLDEVAAAAGVSRRTLLNYFGSKEEIVFSLKAQIPEMIAQAVAARPCDEPLLDMVEGGWPMSPRASRRPTCWT